MLTMRPGRSLFIVATFAMTGVALAQHAPPPGWELSLGGWLAGTTTGADYTHAYTPKVDDHSESTGTAGHTMALRFADGAFGQVAVTRFFGRRFGLQLLAASGRTPIEGSSSEYSYHLEYEAHYPPNYEPTWAKIDATQRWPAPRGTLQHDVLALDAVAVLAARGNLELRYAAGLSAHRLSGDLQSLAYTRFWLGGHSVLFSETHQVKAGIDPIWRFGLNVGGDLSFPLFPPVRGFIEGRYLWVPKTELTLEPEAIVNQDEIVMGLTPEQIAQRTSFRRLEVDPSLVALGAGIRVRL